MMSHCLPSKRVKRRARGRWRWWRGGLNVIKSEDSSSFLDSRAEINCSRLCLLHTSARGGEESRLLEEKRHQVEEEIDNFCHAFRGVASPWLARARRLWIEILSASQLSLNAHCTEVCHHKRLELCRKIEWMNHNHHHFSLVSRRRCVRGDESKSIWPSTRLKPRCVCAAVALGRRVRRVIYV